MLNKKIAHGKWREKVNELRLGHNMKYNQLMIISKTYDDPKFLEALETMYNIHPILSLTPLM